MGASQSSQRRGRILRGKESPVTGSARQKGGRDYFPCDGGTPARHCIKKAKGRNISSKIEWDCTVGGESGAGGHLPEGVPRGE